jgi:hypothetical protein
LQNSVIDEGRFTVGLNYEYEYLTDPLYGTNRIPNINRERTNNSSLTVIANYGLNHKLSFSVIVPFRTVTNEKVLFRGQNKDQYEGGKYLRHSSGMGDLLFLVNYALPTFGKLPTTYISAGVKLANASIEATDKYGKRISDNLQIVSGSVDPIFSIFMVKQKNDFIISGGVLTRMSSRENIFGYKYGNELHSLLNVDYVGNDFFFAGFRLNHVLATRDHYQYGEVTRERGGKWLYAVPKLGLNLVDNFDFEVSLPIPVYQNVNESQLVSSYQLQLNTTYHFAF